MKIAVKSLALYPYLFLLLAAVMIPSTGEHGLLNIKSLALLAAAGGTALYLTARGKLNQAQGTAVAFLFVLILFILSFFILSLVKDEMNFPGAFDQLKLFLLTFLAPCLTLLLVEGGVVKPSQMIKTLLWGNFLFCLFKIILMTLHLLGVIDIWDLSENIGIRTQRMEIASGLDRLQTSVDIATPFLLFFALRAKDFGLNLSKTFLISYSLFAFASNLLSFSRFLIALFLISFFLGLITQSLKKFAICSLILLVAAVIASYTLGFDKVEKAIYNRLESKENSVSDQIRTSQINALMEEFEKTPIFGKGMGSYSEKVIRDQELKHSYEVQWVAFLMQFGVIGIVLLLIPLGLIGFNLIGKFSYLTLFSLWLVSGFTNPFLISLQSGVIYSLFVLAGRKKSA